MYSDTSSKLASVIDTIGHILIVVIVIGSATYLAAAGSIKADTISTVYGAALGFTTGAAISRRPVTVRQNDYPIPPAPVVAGPPAVPGAPN